MPTAATLRFTNFGLKPAINPDLARELPCPLVPSVSYPRGTVLGEILGTNATETFAMTGSPTGGYWTFTFGGVASGAIAYNATATGTETGAGTSGSPYVTVQAALNAHQILGVNAVQTLTGSSSLTGGTITLAYAGYKTATIAYNATAATIQTALQAIFGSGNVTCTGGALNTATPVTITFAGTYGSQPVPLLILDQTQLAGATISIAVTNKGGSANTSASGTLVSNGTVTVTFQNGLGYQPIGTFTVDSSHLSGGTSPTVTPAGGVTGVTGATSTQQAGRGSATGIFTQVNPNATDGSQVAKCILPVDITTDASGQITFSALSSAGGEFSQLYQHVACWFGGFFNTADVPGITESMIFNDLKGRYVKGSIANGGIFYF